MEKRNSNNIIIIEEIAAIAMLLSGLLFVSIPNTIEKSIPYFATAYLILSAAVSFVKWVKNRDGRNMIETIVWGVLAIALIVLFIRFDNSTAVAIAMGTYCVLKSIRLIVFDLIGKSQRKNKVFLMIDIMIHLMLATSIIYSLVKGRDAIGEFIILYGVLYIFEGIASFFSAFTKKHGGTLLTILKGTYAKEILSGLVLAMVTASFLLVFIEPQIATFGDGIWYCFALVTTIGFGDFAAVTTLGRLISIILGIYGIVVVSLITSIIVNVYTEKKGKDNKDQ